MLKLIRKSVVFSIISLVAGCAGTIGGSTFVSWEKEGASNEEMRTAFGLCGGSFDALGNPRFPPEDFDEINACMRSKGFERVDI